MLRLSSEKSEDSFVGVIQQWNFFVFEHSRTKAFQHRAHEQKKKKNGMLSQGTHITIFVK